MNILNKQWLSGGFLLLIALLISPAGHAQNAKTVGEHTIHYVAYNSRFLSPEVASAYGITRGDDIGLVNISVQQTGVIAEGMEASISGHAINMIQQVKHMQFREVREGKAVYYISPFKFDHEDSLTFTFDVLIKATGQSHTVKWQQKFWED